uniref:Uncharacterized protein n=1 Tax=Ignisphaera aggregans TaxID=334771 RepID=A0A7C2ZN46_9CREN
MYRVVFELHIRGLPSEIECLSKLRDYLGSVGMCLGSASAYLCFYSNTMIKVIPKIERGISTSSMPSLHEQIQQTVPIALIFEGDIINEMSEIIRQVYTMAKNCGLAIKLVE